MSDKKFSFVYRTTNLTNGRFYIGVHSTNKLKDGYIGSGKSLKTAVKKYTKSNFETEVMVFCDSREEAFEKERELLKYVFEHPLCYNMREGGGGNCIIVLSSEEKRKKLSDLAIQRYSSPEGAEIKRSISESVKKVFEEKGENYWSDAGKEKRRKTHINFRFKGPRSAETRKKHSDSTKGKKKAPFTEAHKKNISVSKLGKKTGLENVMASSENRAKVGASKVGRKLLVSPQNTRHYVCAEDIAQKLSEGYRYP